MIQLIGLRRLVTMIILLSVQLAAWGGYLFLLDPVLQDAKSQIHAIDDQISELSRKVSNIKQEIAYQKENMPKYQELHDRRGLFLNQDRHTISRLLEEMHGRDKLPEFSFIVQDNKDVPNEDAAALGYRLAKSSIQIKIASAPLDMGIYIFLQDIADSFPGHAYIENFHLKRTAEVNETALNDITNGKHVGFLDAEIAFNWLTLMPQPAEQPASTPEAGGTATGFRGR
ncbi:MAG: hypothetical protein HY052_04180 [Proteobacteria bacterium]|nr:hypothetical protein [Pseudomonadota bacterium]